MAYAAVAHAAGRDRARWLRLVLWPLGLALTAGLTAATVVAGIGEFATPANIAFLVVIGLSFHLSGMVAWRHRPQNRIGPLLVAVGFA